MTHIHNNDMPMCGAAPASVDSEFIDASVIHKGTPPANLCWGCVAEYNRHPASKRKLATPKDDIKISINLDVPPEPEPTPFIPPGEPLAVCTCFAEVVEAGITMDDPAYGFVMSFMSQVVRSPINVYVYEHSVIAALWDPTYRMWRGGVWSRC